MPRERDVRGKGKGGSKIGEGLGGGSVGPGSYSGRPGGNTGSPNGGQTDRGVGSSGTSTLLIAGLIALLLGKKGGGNNGNGGRGGFSLGRIIVIALIVIAAIYLFKSCTASSYESYEDVYTTTQAELAEEEEESIYGSPYNITTINANTTSTVTADTNANTAEVDTTTTEGLRARYYQSTGNEEVNILIYMIGTDLESQYGMATNDLKEMVSGSSTIPDNVHFIIYGGGCNGWNNQIFSNKTNLIYEMTSGGKFKKLEDCGDEVMTDYNTLGNFIRFVRKNYTTDTPQNRNILILWDHGGGSLTGYGYDERHSSSGSMGLDDIANALNIGGIKFDFIGFDACLMATTETAQVLTPWADYMIASEESEPGIGWYYTNWVKKICSDPTTPTLTIAKTIIDDFVDVCNQQCRGQDTTLSVVDLAEFQSTIPTALSKFANSTIDLIEENYSTVATARSSAREFASDSRIDQVDLISLAKNIGNEDSTALVEALQSTIKYNRTSTSMTNAYGLSIYFPYRGSNMKSYVSVAAETNNSIGLTADYTKCIQTFAGMVQSGQYSSNSYGSPFGSLSGYGNYSSSTSYSQSDIYSLLSQMMSSYSGYNSYYGRNIDGNKAAEFILNNQFDANQLVWTKNDNGEYVISLDKSQWELITAVEQNLFIDDGNGYIDYGLDLTADCFTKDGSLVGDFQGYWLSVDGWECAYYRENEVTDESGNTTVTGRIPCLFNGQRAYLVVEHSNNKGEIIGVQMIYTDVQSDVSSKVVPVSEFKDTDTIRLIADYYTYDNEYENTYMISDELVWGEGLEVYDVELQDPASANATYRFTDIYNNTYWTPVLK